MISQKYFLIPLLIIGLGWTEVCNSYFYAQRMKLDIYSGQSLLNLNLVESKVLDYDGSKFSMNAIPPLKGFNQLGQIIYPGTEQFISEIQSHCDSFQLGQVTYFIRDSSLSVQPKTFLETKVSTFTHYTDTIALVNGGGFKDVLMTSNDGLTLKEKIFNRQGLEAVYVGYYRLDSIRNPEGVLTSLGYGFGFNAYEDTSAFYKRVRDENIDKPLPTNTSTREMGAYVITVRFDSLQPTPTIRTLEKSEGLKLEYQSDKVIISIPKTIMVGSINIYDLRGILINQITAISNQVIWDGSTNRGEKLTRGVYLLQAANFRRLIYSPAH